uniref:Uncharacterized protein n=1 Tax=Cacopsylla melanoneura TaxID=428564 RepID=A0A8D8ZPS6_9HEMI
MAPLYMFLLYFPSVSPFYKFSPIHVSPLHVSSLFPSTPFYMFPPYSPLHVSPLLPSACFLPTPLSIFPLYSPLYKFLLIHVSSLQWNPFFNGSTLLPSACFPSPFSTAIMERLPL